MTKLEKVIKGLECCTKAIVTYEARCTDCPYYDGNSKHCIEQTQRDALELLKGQEAQGWVSVKDRLPKENTAVNVVWVNHNPESYYVHIKDKPFTATAVYYDENWYWWDDTIEDIISEYGGRAPIAGMIDLDIEVTHWQYLPEPPKED